MRANRLYRGDCLEILKSFPGGCIDLTVTSPPYDNLRMYQGYTFDFEAVAKELYRVTKSGGVVVWVVGDATVKGSETGTSFRQALYFKEVGFNLHDTMIYSKASQPRQNGVRYEQQHEYMFVLSKRMVRLKNPIKELCLRAGERVQRTCRDGGKDYLSKSESFVSAEKVKGNIWFYGSRKDDLGHPAVFPENLARDHIVSWSNEGDVVLDPFAGSGTTLKMAKLSHRKYIGIEVSPEYCVMICKRLRSVC